MEMITRKQKSDINRKAHELSLRFYERMVYELAGRVIRDQTTRSFDDVLNDGFDELIDEHRLDECQ